MRTMGEVMIARGVWRGRRAIRVLRGGREWEWKTPLQYTVRGLAEEERPQVTNSDISNTWSTTVLLMLSQIALTMPSNSMSI